MLISFSDSPDLKVIRAGVAAHLLDLIQRGEAFFHGLGRVRRVRVVSAWHFDAV
jgi:hypothetical protein